MRIECHAISVKALKALGMLLGVVLIATIIVQPVVAQDEPLHSRIRDRIHADDQLQQRDRDQLRQHLRDCETLDLDETVVETLFDESTPLRGQIRHQERVLAMAREGLPVEPVVEKLVEGRRKGVSEERLELACTRMELQVRTANRVMEQAREHGLQAGDAQTERQLTRGLAMDMWRGLGSEDAERLMESARMRLRDGSCSTTDYAAATATAAELQELGVERGHAIRVAGEALTGGYEAGDIRRLSWTVMATHANGRPVEEVVARLEEGMQQHRHMRQMVQEMWRHGWMGPGDEHGGYGGHSPVDDVIGGPGDHHGGGGGPHDGGMGGHDDGGGMGGNDDGGHGQRGGSGN